MEDADFINYDTDRLRIELEQEKQMKEMLEQSASELTNTVADLEKRLNNVEDEGNEWKTRFETQQELNRQLERQVNLLQDKMENICGNPADRLSSIRSYDEMPVHSDSRQSNSNPYELVLLENTIVQAIINMTTTP
ncbi:Coiled-coil domain-containing protein 169 [Acipenser ruthenus]|uniref:Coiled-coil domain-containing protein 169 n=1 Tax=Acipenser ruthenus TaxID=7906 RepID=A0A444V213_ACIRT|nr:Coiled-coil domain-containing protein 169 [Acipenser ruthenus]